MKSLTASYLTDSDFRTQASLSRSKVSSLAAKRPLRRLEPTGRERVHVVVLAEPERSIPGRLLVTGVGNVAPLHQMMFESGEVEGVDLQGSADASLLGLTVVGGHAGWR